MPETSVHIDSSDDSDLADAREQSRPFRPQRCGAFCPLAIVEHLSLLAVTLPFKRTRYSDSILMVNPIRPKTTKHQLCGLPRAGCRSGASCKKLRDESVPTCTENRPTPESTISSRYRRFVGMSFDAQFVSKHLAYHTLGELALKPMVPETFPGIFARSIHAAPLGVNRQSRLSVP